MTSPLRVSAEVSDAIASGAGVVALESTLICHGLPMGSAAATAREIEDAAALAAEIVGEGGAPDRERLTARGRS